MSERNASLSDIERSRQASRRLLAAAFPKKSSPRPTKRREYSSFAASKVIDSVPILNTQNSQPPSPSFGSKEKCISDPERDFFNWNELLHWCRDASDAIVCFVVDAQGFVLEHDGAFPFEEMEDLGSQLTVILSRADQTEAAGPSHGISLSYETYNLSGTRLSGDGEEQLTLVVITENHLSIKNLNKIVSKAREHNRIL